jgi:hypothetical protein
MVMARYRFTVEYFAPITCAGVDSVQTHTAAISPVMEACMLLRALTAVSLVIEVEACFILTDLAELELAFGKKEFLKPRSHLPNMPTAQFGI